MDEYYKRLRIGQIVKMPKGTGYDGKKAKIISMHYGGVQEHMLYLRLRIEGRKVDSRDWAASWFVNWWGDRRGEG